MKVRLQSWAGGKGAAVEALATDRCGMMPLPVPPHPDSESTEPLSVDGISSDLEEPAEGDEEEEEEEGGTGLYGLQEGSPHTPDQEQFLKQHFETLANGAAPGVVRGPASGSHSLPTFLPPCLAEREGAGQAKPWSGLAGEAECRLKAWLLPSSMTSTTLAGAPVRVPERTESRSISSRFLSQVQSPPLRYRALAPRQRQLSWPHGAPAGAASTHY